MTPRAHPIVLITVSLAAGLALVGCDRGSAPPEPKAPMVIRPARTASDQPPPVEAPRILDHPLVHLGRNGRHAGTPLGVAGVRCFRQIPKSGPVGDAWFYCIADVDMNIDEPRALPAERTEITIATATVTVHPVETERLSAEGEQQVWTLRRVQVDGATVNILGTEFRGLPGYRIGYAMSEDGRGGMFGRTVFELRDPTTKKYLGALCAIVTRFQ
jgi:hypothetical protein